MHIEIADLRRRFGRVTALDGVDLTVSSGMFGLLGTNGAGKTTLMRILAGVLPATSGRVIVGGNDLSARGGRVAVQRRLGYLPQDLGLYPDLTPTEFLDNVDTISSTSVRKPSPMGQPRRSSGSGFW
ncbi:ATP-binding cassette domain-containing protein [Asanoa sp. NPDC050611]|uniref:ATP-binding cassette domain-containing protein n=1 Tax=Asanoa sp. NPDC050611 TaxID=3157098 RepID=UPI0033F7ABA4